MKDEIGYVIMWSDGTININSIRHGRKHCIDSWLEYAPFANWSIARDFGCRCKKIKLTIQYLN